MDFDIKRYEEKRTLTTSQDKDYITGFLLGYGYIKNYYKLIAFDISGKRN